MTHTTEHIRAPLPVAPSTPYVTAWLLIGGIAAGYMAFAAVPLDDAAIARRSAEAASATTMAATRPVAVVEPMAPVEPKPQTIVVTVQAVPPAAEATTEPAAAAPAAVAIIAPKILNGTTTDETVSSQLPGPAGDTPAGRPPVSDLVTGSLPVPPPAAPAKRLPKVTVLSPRAPAAGQAPVATQAKVIAVPERAGPVGLYLGGDATLDEARANWMVSSSKNAALASLEPRVVATDAYGSQSYRLVAGPVATRAEAQKVCAELKAAGVSCRVGGFAGQPF